MNLREQLQEILEPAAAIESVDVSKHIKLTPDEDKMLRLLARAYSMPQNHIVRRLIRQAAIDYSNDGESLALVDY